MRVAQLLNRKRQQAIDDERIAADSAETTERHAGAFRIDADEIGDIGRHGNDITRLILAEEDGVGQAPAFSEIDAQTLARRHRHFSQCQH